MKQLLIVYHSQSGTCAALAEAAAEGAASEDAGVMVCRACDASTDIVAVSDGVLLVAAENSGALAGGMKEFLDRIFYPAIERKLVLPYALLISAGNDGRGAQRQAERILSGIPFTRAMETTIVRGEISDGYRQQAFGLGQAMSAGLGMGIF